MADLFTSDAGTGPLTRDAGTGPLTPLAERLRPRTIGDVIGQRHLLAPGKPLAVAFASGKPHSMILWGPPGVGKTTLARLMADAFNADFVAIAVKVAMSWMWHLPVLRLISQTSQREVFTFKNQLIHVF